MHRSRLSTLLIDVPGDEARAAATFWGAALGVPATPVEGEEQYTALPGSLPHVDVAVQALENGDARYHLDIESDDVAAETARLVGLGAVEVGSWLQCRTLRVPGGLLICVIPVHSKDFERYARTWP
ncbi:VOC family protein [Actinoplanes sp. NPDC049265]|uniref:VOC family protein n=1 Tax=Actinoplanes sp. NPDC049265 TaxID=3363902 RepID=UPI00372408E2